MARPREPIDLIIAKGKKNLTKEEIEQRRAAEIKPCTDGIKAPSYLTPAQKVRFNTIAAQLIKIKIMGETDVDTLARYVAAQSLYEQATKKLRAAMQSTDSAVAIANLEALAKLQDRYFKQAQLVASSLGLTISSRCKLEVPVTKEEPKVNKFSKFNTDEIEDEEGGEE